jgi:GH24 family phage-related lysozyme (muramidase)
MAKPEVNQQAISGAAEALTRWAKDGNQDDRIQAISTLKVLSDILFRSPLGGPTAEPTFNEKDAAQLVLSAATARLKIENRQPVPVPQIAALVGFDRSRVRQFIRAGKLRRTKAEQKRGRQMDAPIVPSDARKLAKEHGISIE